MIDLTKPPEISPVRGFWVAFVVMLFWLSLPWFGLPGPHVWDEMILVAPAVDFAEGRPMSAHTAREAASAAGRNSDRWLGHPPVYQQLLGTWLRVFGVCNSALLWFQVAVNLANYGGFLCLLRRFNIHFGWSVSLALILFSSQFRTWGMRMEGAGAMLLMLGVVFAFRRDILGSFLAGMFWAASGLVLQQAGIYACLFFGVTILDIAASATPLCDRWKRIGAIFAGPGLPILMFLTGIGWDLPAFFDSYGVTLNYAAGFSESRISIVQRFWYCVTFGWERPLFIVMVALLAVVLRGAFLVTDRLQRGLLAAVFLGVIINVWVVAATMNRLAFIYVVVVSASSCLIGSWREGPKWLRIATAVAASVLALVLSLPGLCLNYYHLPGNADVIRRALAEHGYSAVYFNDQAAWDVFGWQLPVNAQALMGSKVPSNLPPREGELFIIAESDYQKMPLRVFGKDLRSVNLNSRRFDLVDYMGNSLLTGKHVGLDLNISGPWSRTP